MRWKKNTPNNGDTRVVKRFALIPVTLNDGYRVWLEKYYLKQRYSQAGTHGYWLDWDSWCHHTHQNKLLDKLR